MEMLEREMKKRNIIIQEIDDKDGEEAAEFKQEITH